MRVRIHCRSVARRSGKILVLFVIMLTSLLGMLGLVIDSGMMMASQRQAYNAADNAALAAAMALYVGDTVANAQAAATTFVQTHMGLTNATVTVNIPPTTGPHSGDVRFAEAIVTRPHNTYFIQTVGVSGSQQVAARAVAGYEAVASGEGAIVLDPTARPGLSVSGGATLSVNGSVIVNSQAAGLDQYGQAVNWGLQQYAMTTSNNSTMQAKLFLVRGGVDTVANYTNIDTSGGPPLYCRYSISPDPLRDLPAPTQSNVSSISDWSRKSEAFGKVNAGETRTFNPGVYEDISIAQGTTVTFNPGVYIFCPTKTGQGLRMNGSCTVTGNGVMFYMTGSNYLEGPSYGYYDTVDDAQSTLDGPLPPTNAGSVPASTDPQSNKVKFASLDINATNANVTLTGLADTSSVYNGILFFQRRRAGLDTNATAQIQGNAGVNVTLGGTLYAKWANFKLAGGGVYDAQFAVGSMAVSGQANVTIQATGNSFGLANQVFLVE